MPYDDVRMYERLTPEQLPPLLREAADFIERVGLARGENIDSRGRHCLVAALNACARRVVWYHSADITTPLARWLTRNRRDEVVDVVRELDNGALMVNELDNGSGVGFGYGITVCQQWNDRTRIDSIQPDGSATDVPVRSQDEVVAVLREAADDMTPQKEVLF